MQFSFHDDINLYVIHKNILEKLNEDIKNLSNMEIELRIMNKIIKCSNNPSDVMSAQDRASTIKNKIKNINSGNYIDNYVKDISIYLNEYSKLTSNTYIFGIDTCISIPKRVYIIGEFMKTASKYIPIEWKCTYDMSKICIKCFDIMKKNGSIMRCKSCNYAYSIVSLPYVFIDNGNIYKPSTYISFKNFRKEYSHICGLINKVAEDEISDIDSYLYRIGIYDPTRDDIRAAIPACGYTNYNDTNYIYTQITGQPLPPLDKYLDTCTQRFIKYYNIFENIDTEGDNITNINFLIKLFLWQENIIYDVSWFRTLSANTEKKHRRNAKRICKVLEKIDIDRNWKYPSEWDALSEDSSRRT